ncbi:family 43 glycosylhydrolase [Phytomonospora sp. NPDC050363]|uniref:family 43 glycosylhydrolase n=1 Tax=Phytomonospora sp. NPDC050363 TaxID=3155642 RepID=UPI0033FDFC3A
MSWLDQNTSRRTVLGIGAGMLAATTAGAPSTAGPVVTANYANPVIWQDFADIDVIRVGDVFYASASTMHYSPGAPILRSWDLVNWEFAGHSVPRLDFGAKYDLNGARGYVRGIWASSLGHRRADSTFYWLGQIDFARTYVYTSRTVEGSWTRHAEIPRAYYDAGLLFDDDDTPYVAYGNTAIHVARLSADARTEVRTQQVFQTPSSIGTLEGARFYKISGRYYIFLTRPANGQYILKSTAGPFGPYELRQVLLNMPGPISGGGVPHQGGLVSTPGGQWYYLAFVDAYPGGRVPALAPITWTGDGWPQVQTVGGAWGASYPLPNLAPHPVTPLTGTDTFQGTALRPSWEWNHNPDTARYTVGNGLTLQTATVTNDLYWARNTLTHRIPGPNSTATVELDLTGMADGDRAGLAMLRDSSAWIGVKRDGSATRVVTVAGIEMDAGWNTTNTGYETAGTAFTGTRIWLRASADIRPGSGRQARFSYSLDGTNFTGLGPAFTLKNAWQFFMGYRYAVFNHATKALGGRVTVRRFVLAGPGEDPDGDPPGPGPVATAAIAVTNDWGQGWQATVTVTAGDTALDGWTLRWSWPGGQTVTSAWNTEWSQSGSTVTAADLGWNGRVEADQSREVFGFTATGPASTPTIAIDTG